ncbi:MAG: HK97 family phage prohead protease [Xanthobacteraceae bacterium]
MSSRHQILKRLALSDDGSVDADARTISFVFSTSNVAADKHRILPGAWQSWGHDGLADFRANPVFLWAHDATQPAIGKVTSLTADKNGDLRGAVCFAAYPFADTVYQLYREGFQRGASVSFEPLDWNYATGPNRAPGALDFTRVKLWEISAVPLPADSSALAAARARGLFTEIDARGRRRRGARAHALRARLICGRT